MGSLQMREYMQRHECGTIEKVPWQQSEFRNPKVIFPTQREILLHRHAITFASSLYQLCLLIEMVPTRWQLVARLQSLQSAPTVFGSCLSIVPGSYGEHR